MEWTVRAVGRAETVEDLRSTVVAVRAGTPVLLGDVADVREAPAVRRGIAHRLKGEVVSCRVIKQFGADTRRRSPPGVREAIAELRQGLPPGVQLRVVYDQSELVDSALGGVGRAVLLGRRPRRARALRPARRLARGAHRHPHPAAVAGAGGHAAEGRGHRPQHHDARRPGHRRGPARRRGHHRHGERHPSISGEGAGRRSVREEALAAAHRGGPADRVRHPHRHRRLPAAVRDDRHRGPHVPAAGGGRGRLPGRLAGAGAHAGAGRLGAAPPRAQPGRAGGRVARPQGEGVLRAAARRVHAHGRARAAGGARHHRARPGAGLRRGQRLHAPARRGRVPAADGAARRRPRSTRWTGSTTASRTCCASSPRSRTWCAAPAAPSAPRTRCRTPSRTCSSSSRRTGRADLDDAGGGDARGASRRCPACPCSSRRRSACASTRAWAAAPADLSVRIFGPDLDDARGAWPSAPETLMREGPRRGGPARGEAQRPAAAAHHRGSRRRGARGPDARRRHPRGARRAGGRGVLPGVERPAPLRSGGAAARTTAGATLNAIRTLLVDGHDGTRIPLGQLATIEETFGAGASAARPAAGASPSRPASPAATWAAPRPRCGRSWRRS